MKYTDLVQGLDKINYLFVFDVTPNPPIPTVLDLKSAQFANPRSLRSFANPYFDFSVTFIRCPGLLVNAIMNCE